MKNFYRLILKKIKKMSVNLASSEIRCWLKSVRRYILNNDETCTEFESQYTLKTAPYSEKFLSYIFHKSNQESCDSLLNDIYCKSRTDLLDMLYLGYKNLSHSDQYRFLYAISNIPNIPNMYGKFHTVINSSEFLHLNFVFNESCVPDKTHILAIEGISQSLRDLILSRLHDKNRDIFLDLEF